MVQMFTFTTHSRFPVRVGHTFFHLKTNFLSLKIMFKRKSLQTVLFDVCKGAGTTVGGKWSFQKIVQEQLNAYGEKNILPYTTHRN